MRVDIKNIASFLLEKYLLVLFITFLVTITSAVGLNNFKLDASSDALVLESDESLKTYREAEDEFGDSSFLIVTYEPNIELFSDYSLNRIANLENDLKNTDGVDSVLSILDAPIFFQPRVGLTEVADNLKDLTDENINLTEAREEIINNPIYKELIISNDGKVTAMQVVLRGNDEYDELISQRYNILEKLDSKEILTSKNKSALYKELREINKRISQLNNDESEFSKSLISEIRLILDKYRDEATIYLGGSFWFSGCINICNNALSFLWFILVSFIAFIKCIYGSIYNSWIFRFYGLEDKCCVFKFYSSVVNSYNFINCSSTCKD